MTSRGIEWGLLGPREADRIWTRHILNSVAISPLIPLGQRIADVGSGAGLPGLPLAILRPDLHITCIEPLLRRSEFLALAIAELGLDDRVAVIRARAEELAAGTRFATVTSRALAPLARLVEWSWPLVATDGQIVAIKGRSAVEELARDAGSLNRRRLVGRVQPCSVAGSDETTYAVIVRADPRRRQAD